jgi:steroid delta-isomerase-like uncharacterized protein
MGGTMKIHHLFFLAFFVFILGLSACDQNTAAKLEANKNIVRQFAEAVNNDNYDALDEIVRADFVRHSQATSDVKIHSLEEFKQFAKLNAEAIPDMVGTIDMMVAEGALVAINATFTGTQIGPMGPFPATNKSMVSKTMAIFRLQDGKIAELWIEWDNMAMLKQLGHFPPPGI